jgi:predicted amidohydrolase
MRMQCHARSDARSQVTAAAGAKILVLPETAVTGYLSDDLKTNWSIDGRPLNTAFPRSKELTAEYAEPANGASVRHFAQLAVELGCYITVPFIEVDQGVFYNAVSLVGPSSGAALAHYRKNCPWPYPEKSWATPGEGVDGAIFDTEYGRVGMAICFDIHTILRKYRDSGLWALLYPVAWVRDHS